MPVLREQLETPLGLEETFAFIADFGNAGRWDPGVATSERLDPGPLRVGARFRLGVRMRGGVAPMEYRITRLEPLRRVVLAGEGSGVTAVDDIRFEPAGPDGRGTRIDYTADIRLRGLLRLLAPFLGAAFSKIARDAAGGMRRALDARAVESGAAGATPVA
jgi:carbon monoxide dehydrogenase subunit G